MRSQYVRITKDMNTLVVVADLAGFKAFKLDNGHSNPRLELLEQFDNADARTRIVDNVSDLSGRFRRGAAKAAGVVSDGERHNIELEKRKRCVRQLATQLNSLMRDPVVDRCYFAASREINNHLLDALDPRVRTKIELNLPADLMKVDKSALIGHFQSARL